MSYRHYIPLFLLALTLTACRGQQAAATEPALVGPTFEADSARAHIIVQCLFGPRTMNSAAHDSCEAWIVRQFEARGLAVERQRADVKGWDAGTLHSTNIIARLAPQRKERLLICAHWDSRPWADNDADSTNWHTPVPAANDGASGVAVMLELARVIDPDSISCGIDFVSFDAEDYGTPQFADQPDDESTWALGAQHFARNLPCQYTAGILLDMVGGQGAHFAQEQNSAHYARTLLDQVWQAAATAGYADTFPTTPGANITDDHGPLNAAGVPTIDIVPYAPDCPQSVFGPTWHTLSDNPDNIATETLKAVGQTLVQYLYTHH